MPNRFGHIQRLLCLGRVLTPVLPHYLWAGVLIVASYVQGYRTVG